ncbi:Flp family type IVb pilin [Terasakiella pusilla]|uniref:Flp family type IVb pilin n=1 Tax=Terasakiella pusilla TaxID=64973 RepID=UPI003AA82A72
MRAVLKELWTDQQGVTAIEYGILAASMAAAIGLIFGSDGAFVSALNERFANIADQITTTNK